MTAPSQQSLSTQELLLSCIKNSRSRVQLWVEFIKLSGVLRMAEIGVYRGDFAAELLRSCDGLTAYYMVDPWRKLADWNKPSNYDSDVLERYARETKDKTEFASGKRIILRGKTTEVIDQIPDGSLDFAYIDGDHTLKGIAIDLIRVYPKLRNGGFIGGDDFRNSIWEHSTSFEPTLVFPFSVYFAEAVGATIYALPYSQFCLEKREAGQFQFMDLTGNYTDLTLRGQVAPKKVLKLQLWERVPLLMRVASKAKGLFQ